VCCWNGEVETVAAECVARVWKTRTAYGHLLGALSENGHLENLEGCERITLSEILLK
jgi:hypothetical protein